MNYNNIKLMAIRQIGNLLNIKSADLMALAEKHGINEKRQRKINVFGLIFVSLTNLFNGLIGHKDRKLAYAQEYNIEAEPNTFSDRLSEIPPAFFYELLHMMIPKINKIGSPVKRKRLRSLITKIMIEDASVFQCNEKLIDKLGKTTGRGKNPAIKLFLAIDALNGKTIKAKVKSANKHDSNHVTNSGPKSCDIRDMAWCSYRYFLSLFEEGKFYISRVKANLNPLIVDSNHDELKDRRFKDVDWEAYTGTIELGVIALNSKGEPLETASGDIFTMKMCSEVVNGERYWYLYHLPTCEANLTFEDIHQLYRVRWRIEEIFKEIKSYLGSGCLRPFSNLNCVMNILLMGVIVWLVLKNNIVKIASAHGLSPYGYKIDRIMKSIAGHYLIDLLRSIWEQGPLHPVVLREKTSSWAKLLYSKRSAESERHEGVDLALTNLLGA